MEKEITFTISTKRKFGEEKYFRYYAIPFIMLFDEYGEIKYKQARHPDGNFVDVYPDLRKMKYEAEDKNVNQLISAILEYSVSEPLDDLIRSVEDTEIGAYFHPIYVCDYSGKCEFTVYIEYVDYIGGDNEKTIIEQIDGIKLSNTNLRDISPFVFECLYEELVRNGFPKAMKELLRHYIRSNITSKGKDFFNKGYYHRIMLIEEIFVSLSEEEPLPWLLNSGKYVCNSIYNEDEYIEQ